MNSDDNYAFFMELRFKNFVWVVFIDLFQNSTRNNQLAIQAID